MSTAGAGGAALRTGPRSPFAGSAVTLPTVVASEWIKLRSLRSTWLCLLGAVASMLLIAPFNANSDFDGLGGVIIAQLPIGALGVVLVTGEYATGMIRSSLAAVPRRAQFVFAKAAVYPAFAFVVSLATLSAAMLLGRSRRTKAPIPDGIDCVRAVLTGSAYVALVAMLGIGLGFVLRSTAATISAFMGFVFVGPFMLQILADVNAGLGKFLPYDILVQATSTASQGSDYFTAWTGIAVLAGWVLITLATALLLVQRRDA
jgi:ABC-2 type transport system permease protein